MEATIQRVRKLVEQGQWKVSDHAADAMDDDGILSADVLAGVESGMVVEDYPRFGKGPSVLVLQFDSDARPLHVLWGIPAGVEGPAVVVTVYRPDLSRWSADFLRRLT